MRGSEALRAAWRERGDVLDDESVELLAGQLDDIEALQVSVDGGDRPVSITGTFSVGDPDPLREHRAEADRPRAEGAGVRQGVRARHPWPDQYILEVVAGPAAQR